MTRSMLSCIDASSGSQRRSAWRRSFRRCEKLGAPLATKLAAAIAAVTLPVSSLSHVPATTAGIGKPTDCEIARLLSPACAAASTVWVTAAELDADAAVAAAGSGRGGAGCRASSGELGVDGGAGCCCCCGSGAAKAAAAAGGVGDQSGSAEKPLADARGVPHAPSTSSGIVDGSDASMPRLELSRPAAVAALRAAAPLPPLPRPRACASTTPDPDGGCASALGARGRGASAGLSVGIISSAELGCTIRHVSIKWSQ
jgi:hypothetical protein